ncbi:(d)CMP kinase [Leeuwenhoekiella sp. MAR_2009_132]|uniref:(d)CMP kinase n=1 Tax=Leeuwenhoekiella sp. MAR_2009_132 TaxID=1392489 RepID=UPI0004915A81|nr:(d)CMP kinase [Leeuwenhoekiella sp. MAR_2009_132]
MKKITIAIDGFSSTGKSTVAKMLAKELDYIYVDTGAMYRAVTLFAMRKLFIKDGHFDKEGLIRNLFLVSVNFKLNPVTGIADVYLNNENVEKEIRTLEVSNFVSPIAAISEVRQLLVQKQHEMGKEKGIVMDGRDIGTVVFPDAELKVFMTASADERARRRYDELIAKGDDVSFEAVLENVQKRDRLDTSREDSPLVQADDAILLDNTYTNIEDQFHILLQLAKDRIYGRC